MTGDETVRKEFEAAMRKLGLSLHFAYEQGRGYLDADTWKAFAAWQASRSAAIQECADKMRAMNHPAYADMILLALKDRTFV